MWSLLGYDRIAEHLCKFHANLVAGGAGGGGWGGGKWSGKGGKVGAVAINKSNTFNPSPVSQGLLFSVSVGMDRNFVCSTPMDFIQLYFQQMETPNKLCQKI